MMIRKRNYGMVIFLAAVMVLVSSYTPAYSAPKELKFASFSNRTTASSRLLQEEFCAKIGKETNGSVKVNFFGVDEIAGTKEMPALAKNGTIDIIQTAPTYYPSIYPIAASLQQLTLLNKGPESSQYAWRSLFREFPEIRKEFGAQNLHLINRSSLGTYYMLSKKPITKLGDLKGMKIRNWGGKLAAEYVTSLGATPVFVPPADYYEALMRGVYDAFTGDCQMLLSYKVYELAKYVGMPTGSIVGWFIAMNQDKWNSLTPSEQQVITNVGAQWGAKDLASNMAFDRDGLKQLEAKGVKYIPFPEKEQAATFVKFGDPWVKLKKTMKEDLKIDPAFVEKFVTRYKQLVTEYEANYLNKGIAWKYQ